MKNSRGYKSGNEGKETQHEEKRGRGRSEEGFGKLSVRKALPLALMFAMVFSIAGVVVSGGFLPLPKITPDVHSYGVSPPEGDWGADYIYHLNITAARNATLTLQIWQPANNTWENKSKWNYYANTTPPKPYNWSRTIQPFIEQSRGGISSYQFLYEDGIVNTTLGPYPGPSLIVPIPPPYVRFYPTKLTAYRGHEPSDSWASNEADYNMYSGDTTAFDYEVNATSNVDRWFDISLRVYDPVEGEWELKGENKPTDCKRGVNVTLTWRKIKPFEFLHSLNESKIREYIGKYSNYTFVYDGNKSVNFTGPKLVVAFKGPEINPPVVSWGDNFTYSINVTACKNLGITLKYYNGTGWNEVGEKNYTFTGKIDWTLITWNCTAMDSWEEVIFEWKDGGSKATAAKTATLELGVSQLSASKPKRNYPVPVIVKVKEEK